MLGDLGSDTPGKSLRELLAAPGLLVAPGVYDGLSAALVQSAGFDAAYMSGAAVAASAVGLPDIGLATLTEMVAQAGVIKRRLGVPLIADADTGFGDVKNTYRAVREYALAGVAAIQIEDQVFPKKCGHLDDKRVIETEAFVDKISAAVDARGDSGLLIVARTDARATHGFPDAIERAKAYSAAGADVIFVEAPQSRDEIRAIPREIDAPVLFNLVAGGKSPAVTLSELEAFGYALVIIPGACVGPVVSSVTEALRSLRQGDPEPGSGVAPRELFDTLGLPFWEALHETHDRGAESA
ncbi:isocitrate lyase/PEP mutase family protein [Nocardiopsis aegyptia]|uniref:2-methylisocitrate lyase-like PEP mutase family enzyme n=1 Tax=Nocardiopsis aegyptia TaxID=220378 RepID=A0A7Z0EN96_9ACTN|nr:isocitrate lyase/PEP mutase family protein [Nocardiopsis aegyptia]NYJ35019.1 2-methylisocitrate lyase-like PEP mutase family enzyme [Nocardiopsis aegyptia]